MVDDIIKRHNEDDKIINQFIEDCFKYDEELDELPNAKDAKRMHVGLDFKVIWNKPRFINDSHGNNTGFIVLACVELDSEYYGLITKFGEFKLLADAKRKNPNALIKFRPPMYINRLQLDLKKEEVINNYHCLGEELVALNHFFQKGAGSRIIKRALHWYWSKEYYYDELTDKIRKVINKG